MKFQRVLLALLLVVPLFAAGWVSDEVEKKGALAATTAHVAHRSAAEKPKPEYLRLRDELVGYSLRYPRGWEVKRRPVGGTEFATGARCRSVEVVDFTFPAESGIGAGGFILHSFVQVCARPLTDGSRLDDFMRQTYRNSFLAEFELAKVGGVRAYTVRKGDQNLIFLQTDDYRLQIYTSVVADPERRAGRRAQVRQILRSFSPG